MLRLAYLCNNLINKCNDRLIDLMCLIDRLDHLCLRNLIGTGLDHNNLLTGRSNSQLKIAFLPLLLGRIHNEFTIDQTHLCHCTWSVKWNIRNAGSN